MPIRFPTIRPLSDDQLWAAAAVLLPMLMLGVAVAVGYANFARWDNMEVFLPSVWYTHSEILHGRFPLWNPYQNLGEPIHAFGLGGAFYLPYTLLVALTTLIGAQPATVMDLIAITHVGLMGLGVYLLTRDLGVRAPLAQVAALSGAMSGFGLWLGAVWVHALPNLALSVWAMWALHSVVVGVRPARGIAVSVVSLAAVFMTGHVQSGANVWIAVWPWAFVLAWVHGVLRKRLVTLVAIMSAAALLAMPAVLPTALILPEAYRLGEHVGANLPGFAIRALIGLVVPGMGRSDGVLDHTVLVTTFTGAWVIPGILFGLVAGRGSKDTRDARLTLLLWATAALAIVFVVLSLGEPGKLYTLLHRLPGWSRFRTPFKYFERAVPLLIVAGALGLELAARKNLARQTAMLIVLPLCAAALVLVRPALIPYAATAGMIGLLTIFLLALVSPRHWAVVLVPLVILQCAALIGPTHAPGRFKSYTLDRDATVSLPRQVKGVALNRRVLPLSNVLGGSIRSSGTYFSATLDRYENASGHRFALTSRRLDPAFPAALNGVYLRKNGEVRTLLRSNWLQHADVGFLVVHESDKPAQVQLDAEGFTRAAQLKDGWLYRNPKVSPRAFFASELWPYSVTNLEHVLWDQAPLTAVTVEGVSVRAQMPPARVTSIDWADERIRVGVDAPAGGVLALSTSYSTEWQASVDGARARVLAVNGMFAGVRVPPGAREVQLEIRRWPLYVGLLLAMLGVCIAAIAAAHARRQDRAGSDEN